MSSAPHPHRRVLTAAARVVAVAIAFAATGCTIGPSVVRVKGGRVIDGRWISPEAYAAFLEGSLLEESGDDANAAVVYKRAISEDPRAAEIWARLGAFRCVHDRAAANAAFDRASALNPDLAAPWLARARCDLSHADVEHAKAAAVRAAQLSPNDLETTLVAADAFGRAGDAARATAWLHAATLRWPGSAMALRAFRDQTAKAGELAQGIRPSAVRSAQIRAQVGSGKLAVLAVTQGRLDVAKDVATLVLAAEPENTDARAALLLATDLDGDPEGFASALAPLPEDRLALDPLAVEWIGALLARRAGREAASAWSAAWRATETARGGEKAVRR